VSIFKEYYHEKYGLKTLESTYGFICYNIKEETCFIGEIFVKPERRGDNRGSVLADEIANRAKEAGCKFLTCTVQLAGKEPERSLVAIIKYGFKITDVVGTGLYLTKEL